jgi:hypothetical protein
MAYGKKIDRTFYAFQSEPKESPQVLVLGLNPHGTYNYAGQYENNDWKIPNGMTPDVFVHQNPCIGGKDSWNIIKKMKVTTSVCKDLDEAFSDSNMMYMNILYFNSDNFAEFQRSFPAYWREAFSKCAEFTGFLIHQIVKPKRIVCFGIDKCFNKFIGSEQHTPVEVILPRKLVKCEVGGIPAYGIIHPSARPKDLPDDLRRKIGELLAHEWFGYNGTL